MNCGIHKTIEKEFAKELSGKDASFKMLQSEVDVLEDNNQNEL